MAWWVSMGPWMSVTLRFILFNDYYLFLSDAIVFCARALAGYKNPVSNRFFTDRILICDQTFSDGQPVEEIMTEQ